MKHSKIIRSAVEKRWTPVRLDPNYTMRIDYMMDGKICTRMYVNFKEEKIKIKNTMASFSEGNVCSSIRSTTTLFALSITKAGDLL